MNRNITWEKEIDDSREIKGIYYAYNDDDREKDFPLACIIHKNLNEFITHGRVFSCLHNAKQHAEKVIRA